MNVINMPSASEAANDELIDTLRDLLARALVGDITGIVYTVYYPEDDSWSPGWISDAAEYRCVGAIELLKQDYQGSVE